MSNAGDAHGGADDPYDLNRFVAGAARRLRARLPEVRGGRKRSHWMWYIFPQLGGLGFSSTAKFYGIKSLDEAKAYLAHPVLGPRLRECAEAAVGVEGRSATEIFGSPDDMKLRSCATLFACVSPPGSVFERLLEKYYGGQRDGKTLQLAGAVEARTVKAAAQECPNPAVNPSLARGTGTTQLDPASAGPSDLLFTLARPLGRARIPLPGQPVDQRPAAEDIIRHAGQDSPAPARSAARGSGCARAGRQRGQTPSQGSAGSGFVRKYSFPAVHFAKSQGSARGVQR